MIIRHGTYRVIYNANGDLWARDVISNPPKPPRKQHANKGTKYTWDNCHVCGKRVAWNWYVRHLKSGCEVG